MTGSTLRDVFIEGLLSSMYELVRRPIVNFMQDEKWIEVQEYETRSSSQC